MASADHVMVLSDGRRLGYAEYGDPGGRPVVALHGCPDSRLIWRLADSPARDVGVRLVAPDRPGFGLSDPKPRRAVLDWPDDLAELTDELALHEFAVLAISAGGLYGVASAIALPQRVRALGLLSVIGPLDLPGMTEGMGASPRAAYALARRAPWALGLVVRALATAVRRNPERAGRQITKTRPPADRAIIERPDVYALLLEALPQNLAHPTSVTGEFSLQVQPWGFSASEVRVPTVVWQGGADSVHPPVMGRYLAAAIPGADLVYDEKGTAFTFLDDAQDVLTRLLVAWGDQSR